MVILHKRQPNDENHYLDTVIFQFSIAKVEIQGLCIIRHINIAQTIDVK